jgi:hypothetical protein
MLRFWFASKGSKSRFAAILCVLVGSTHPCSRLQLHVLALWCGV